MKTLPAPFAPAIGWFMVSTVLLIIPGSAFPKENWLNRIWADKWVHIGIFGLLVVLWCLSWRSLKKDIPSGKWVKIFIAIAIGCLCYGIVMEFVQLYFVPHRSFDFGDIVADAVGCAAGAIFSIKRYIKK